ncbi:MAG: hypothetical protein QOK10_1846, partial [Pseudonocardiales bacterium]|nr:hypothetical protein [Pseudonocardiales bacterium]
MDGRRKALIVATDEYLHEGLRSLASPAADATALAAVLGDPEIGGFEVQILRNLDAHLIQEQIEELFTDNRREDVILLHFSCHGLKSESGELFFAAHNTRPHRLATAIPADFVQRCMRASRSRSIVLFLDCCYGGAFGQGVRVRAAGDVNVIDSFPTENLGGGRGRAVISASSSMEYAFEGDQLSADNVAQPSVFTSALVRGLESGEADRDEDGWVSLNELYEYVFDEVRERNPNQTPTRDIEMQGDLYLAHSRRRRVHAAPIPADLLAAMTDPNMYTRLGAVNELQSRLASENLEVAAGAHRALSEMVASDIRFVAEAAAAALQSCELRVDVAVATGLEFGKLDVGSHPQPRLLQLLGSPLARSARVDTPDSWIRIQQRPDGYEVCVDTASAGARVGRLTLTGPTGELTVPVSVEVLAPAAAEEAGPQVSDGLPATDGVRRTDDLTSTDDLPAIDKVLPAPGWWREHLRRKVVLPLAALLALIIAAVLVLSMGGAVWTRHRPADLHLRHLAVGGEPLGVAISDGRAYIANRCQGCGAGQSPSVSVIDTSTEKQVNSLQVKGPVAGVLVGPDKRHLYLSTFAREAYVLDIASGSVKPIGIASGPGIALDPIRGNAYLVNHLTGVVTVISTADDKVLSTIRPQSGTIDEATPK